MNIRRDWVTPLTAGAFMLTAATGVLIFFHLDSGLNKTAHEWLSWALLIGAALHIVANIGAFKRHLQGLKGQAMVGLFLLVLGLSFLPLGAGGGGEPPFIAPARALAEAPLELLAQVAKIDLEELQRRLSRQGLPATAGARSLADLTGPDKHRQVETLAALLRAAPAAGTAD